MENNQINKNTKIAGYLHMSVRFMIPIAIGVFAIAFVFTAVVASPFNYKQPNNMLGNLVNNLNLTGLDDSSYDASYKISVPSSEILKYVLKYAKNIEPEDAVLLADLIKKECKRYNLNPFLVLAIIHVESSFNPMAVSSQGAVGLMQMMPETAMYIAPKKGLNIADESLIADPLVNVELGIYYFSRLLKRYNKLESALFAYNYGPGRFESLSESEDGQMPLPKYVNKVLTFKTYLERKSVAVTSQS